MRLITDGGELSTQLQKAAEEFEQIHFAVAWANAGNAVYGALLRFRHKIRFGVVGTDYMHTHPDVLNSFLESSHVRFMEDGFHKKAGVFHPKMYVFWTDEQNWRAFVGSANLTNAAITSNHEAVLLVSSDAAESQFGNQLLDAIGKYWSQATQMTPAWLSRYQQAWRPSGTKSSERKPEDATELEAGDLELLPWEQFIQAVCSGSNALEERLELLERSLNQFRTSEVFSDIAPEWRKVIAGMKNQACEYWAWFGRMRKPTEFRSAVESGDPNLDSALNCIPMHGNVSKHQFDEYSRNLSKAFPNGNFGVASGTRLLCMKRPDLLRLTGSWHIFCCRTQSCGLRSTPFSLSLSSLRPRRLTLNRRLSVGRWAGRRFILSTTPTPRHKCPFTPHAATTSPTQLTSAPCQSRPLALLSALFWGEGTLHARYANHQAPASSTYQLARANTSFCDRFSAGCH